MPRSAKPSAGLFGLVLILFAFPFTAVSCNGQVAYEFTGYQLAFGMEIQDLGGFPSHIGPYAALTITLVAAAIAAVAAWLGHRTLAAAVGSIGLLSLLIYNVQFYLQLRQNGSQDSEVAIRMLIRTAMWLTVGALLAGIVTTAYSRAEFRIQAGQRGTTLAPGRAPVDPPAD